METAAGLVFLSFCLIVAAFIIMSVRIFQANPKFFFKITKYMVIVFFWGLCSVASIAIGFRIQDRHNTTYTRGSKSVSDIWGGSIVQAPPSFHFKRLVNEDYNNQVTGKQETKQVHRPVEVGLTAQKLDLKIESKIRTKGLLKFPGYLLNFQADYVLANTLKESKSFSFVFKLPQNAGNITNIQINVDDKEYKGDESYADGIHWTGELEPGETHKIQIQYKAQGTEFFTYSLGDVQKQISKLQTQITTNFTDIDIPEKAMVPTVNSKDNAQTIVKWEAENLITGQSISLKFNISGNHGKIASKLFYYAPVSLFLFLSFLLLFSVPKEINLHPMNYFFIIIGFFVFYLLGSYLVSYISVIAGIIISLLISTGVMVYYVHLINGSRYLINITLIMAVIFQWLFSLAFFLPEHTGFLITVASVLAFIALMKTTSQINWEDKF